MKIKIAEEEYNILIGDERVFIEFCGKDLFTFMIRTATTENGALDDAIAMVKRVLQHANTNTNTSN